MVATLVGAGQRLHFSFGGELTLRKNGNLQGEYVVVINPKAPNGTSLSAACRYTKFENAVLEGNKLHFRGKGECVLLSTSGKVQRIDAVNDFDLVDIPNGKDQINVDLVGATGIAVPAGEFEFGDHSLQVTAS